MIKNASIVIALVLSITAISVVFLTKEKYVYINSGKVFSEFKMSKELFKQLDDVQKTRQHILDSLYRNIQQYSQYLQENKISDPVKINQLAMGQEEFQYKQHMFEEENSKLIAEYNEKIWSQINGYIAEYGKEHHYTFILGASGQGNLMYADENKEVTEDVLNYINKRYDDKPVK